MIFTEITTTENTSKPVLESLYHCYLLKDTADLIRQRKRRRQHYDVVEAGHTRFFETLYPRK